MAKIVIAGNAVVVTSAMKLTDLAKIAKYRPQSLVLKGGEDGKEPIFAIGIAKEGYGEINNIGASFDTESHDDAKLATLTMQACGIGGDIREYIADSIGSAINNLNKLEETLPAVLEEIEAEKAAVMDSIVVAQ